MYEWYRPWFFVGQLVALERAARFYSAELPKVRDAARVLRGTDFGYFGAFTEGRARTRLKEARYGIGRRIALGFDALS